MCLKLRHIRLIDGPLAGEAHEWMPGTHQWVTTSNDYPPKIIRYEYWRDAKDGARFYKFLDYWKSKYPE